ncbi:endo-beta-N-acetylglucosaminidase [Coprobacter tertius]|uniref:T9SS type A sorting domain-containing protein n=1 Tax=Coprobacter tertius TaxID=2944915 RepID=A0ABT1MD25_9BACT|nr:LamG-like jellyroll fold domain-containing protein [Coprobacter tertius]MCP9610548.1 T9SS type A sorting domain-containing protein [Coprobacter tertius]
MKKTTLISVALVWLYVFSAFGQSLPTHPKYINAIEGDKGFADYFAAWEPGTPLSEDENFYISRVKPKERFVNTQTQVDPTMTQDRKFCWWVPIGCADNYWGPLPRYVFDGDNFSLWSYIDSHGGWAINWVRVPGGFSDVCHKNGVPNGCLLFFDSGAGAASAQRIINMLNEKENGNFKNAEKLIKFMKYYGVDGLGINPESYISGASDFQDFLAECHRIAPELGWHFTVYWYGTMSNSGGVNFGSTFPSGKENWLSKNGQNVTDMYMLNYNWGGYLSGSANAATQYGRSTYDIYAGFDIQGRWIHDQNTASGNHGWTELTTTPASIVFWGAHQTNQVYGNSGELGSNDKAVQKTYQIKLEQVFCGGLRNVKNLPPVNDNVNTSSINAMKKFHGIAKYLPARSTLQELPFVTRFGLGNGEAFRSEGKTTFNQKWYNISTQDMLPTWRWWITDDNGNVPEDAIECEFTFDDSWFAGSCLAMRGATQKSNVRLFKTNFDVKKGDIVSLRYKVKNGTDPHLKLCWSFVGSENTMHSAVIPAAAKSGEWTEFKSNANKLQMNGKVACIGVTVENTSADYEILLGEFSIVNNNKQWNPVAPQITLTRILDRKYNNIDYKIIFKSRDQAPNDPATPIYNEDVDTWYFEIWSQPEGGEPTLCTATTSWAAYVVGAPALPNVSRYRIGVCAVAPDGKTKSEIVWSEYEDHPAVTPVDDLEIDKVIIKKGEEFTVRFKDILHEEASYWSINDPLTGDPVQMVEGGNSMTTSIDKEGSFDVVVSMNDGSEITVRGFVQISPESTGALPIIADFTADKTTLDRDETTTVSYTAARLGEGKVSRGLDLHDPTMFRLPSEAIGYDQQDYSVALWFKADNFSHDRYGTNLINKRTTETPWPNNNWGAFWVHIWPQVGKGGNVHPANEISYTTFGNTVNFGGQRVNQHENPNGDCMSTGHSVSLNTWNHLAITLKGGTTLTMYFNGKKVAQETGREFVSYYKNGGISPIYFGGSNQYHSGFNGTIDEVQVWDKAMTDDEVLDAMKGYDGREVPANVRGYYDFEAVNPDNTFTNKGHGTGLEGRYITFIGGGGESTSGTIEETQKPNIDVLGNPAISGSLDIKTTAEFEMPDASVVQDGSTATASYTANGNYDVTLTLENMWGKDVKKKTEYIVVSGYDGIEDTEAIEKLGVYPNPFTDAVNMKFRDAGTYKMIVFAIDGTQIDEKSLEVTDGEIVRVAVNGTPGMYIVRVSKDGVNVRTVKVNKQ